jgi:hypothetical protein
MSASGGFYMDELEKCRIIIDGCEDVLKFYANESNYFSDSDKGTLPIWNDQGMKARSILKAIENIKP